MPTGIRKRPYKLSKGNAKERKKAAQDRANYIRWKEGKSVPRVFNNGRPTVARSKGTQPRGAGNQPRHGDAKMKRHTVTLNMPVIGTDIAKAKKCVRAEINLVNASLKTLRNKYKELVALERLMKDVTRR